MQYSSLEISSIFVLFCAFAMGGILKGATGAGSPLITIPVLAIFFDAKLAVILMCIPNLISNSAQIVQYKNSANSIFFSIKFAVAGGIGCLAGTIVLASMETGFIQFLVGTLTLGYVLVRLLKPKKQISCSLTRILTPLVGLFGGVVQGSCGISAPVALSFLNALNLKRETFIFSISCFFFSMALVQICTVYFFGLLSLTIVFLGLLSIIPQIAFMPVGNYLIKKFSAGTFDKLILLFLIILSIKILSELMGF
ncbi:sulfite exporter TauE/SafE family protein [Paracoccaceae bacterium]|nr:sulfite exporter TauE/SafE family protein [Paracoccaceae bacterium]